MGALLPLLERLSNEFGPSGHERAVRALVRGEVEGVVDHLEVDALGNLITFKAGDGPAPRLRVLLSAHMDEVGFMVTRIERSGLLRFRRVGGLDGRTMLAKRVVIGEQRLPGVIGAPVPHLQKPDQARRPVDIDDLRIDIGVDEQRGAEGRVSVGDYGTFATRFTVLSDDPSWPAVRGKAFDDRAGCAALVALLQQRYPVDVMGVFTVQEEIGLRGARVAGYRSEPDAAIALEGTLCDDVPREPDDDRTPVTRLGHGPAITLMDRSFLAHPGMVALLRETAEAEKITVQYKAPGLGGTDTGAIHLAREGVPSIVVSIPCRYIHSPASILNLNDLARAIDLVGGALRRIDRARLDRV